MFGIGTKTVAQETRDDVARGAAILDKAYPGWEGHINLKTLSLATTNNCILGQLYGGYVEGLTRIEPYAYREPIFGPETGFARRMGPDQSWDDLDRAWKDLIMERVHA